MESLNWKNNEHKVNDNKLFCHIRKEWVSDKPEERVRQKLLSLMISQLNFPTALLVVERGLREMPHLSLVEKKAPKRRADIICFSREVSGDDGGLSPLLLIECKAVKLTRDVITQAAGYNYYLKAPFITIVNDIELITCWYDGQKDNWQFIKRLPSYNELMMHANTINRLLA